MKKSLTTAQFLDQAKKIHNNKYDYSKSIYTKKKNKLIIICSVHGEFEQCADNHIGGQGCPKCKADKNRTNIKEFIEKSKIIHSNYYNYDKTIYFRADQKVIITCSIHGDFIQTPNSHLAGKGCYSCGWEKHSGSYGSVVKYNPTLELYIYLIKCYKNNEQFYKIGLAKNVKQRLWDIPYKKEIIKTLKGNIKDLYPLEQSIRNLVKQFKYLPIINFAGKNECFIIPEDSNMLCDIFELFSNLSNQDL